MWRNTVKIELHCISFLPSCFSKVLWFLSDFCPAEIQILGLPLLDGLSTIKHDLFGFKRDHDLAKKGATITFL